MKKLLGFALVVLSAAVFDTRTVHSHGDVAPQAVDTSALPALGEEWLEENPWRDPEGKHWHKAIDIGASGYNQNCARCHGLGAVSGGLAPDLRYLSADWDGDEWYMERYRHGVTQNGITKMPAFGELLGQEAAWAIRTYLETRPDDGALDDYQERLLAIRDTLQNFADQIDGGAAATGFDAQSQSLRQELDEINATVETGSGAPKSDSAVSRAALVLLEGSPQQYAKAAEILTVGLSSAQ